MNRTATSNAVNPIEMALGYWYAVVQHKWWILMGTVTFTVLGITAIALLPNEYRSTTTILVDPQKISDRYVTSTVSADPSARLNAISQEVLSATRLQEVIDQFHLYSTLKGKVTREQIIEVMRDDIGIGLKHVDSGGLSAFTITYSGRDPQLVAQVTNQLASSFIEWNLKTREQEVVGTSEFLAAQLKQAKEDLEEQERKVQVFKLQHIGEMPDQQPANLAALSQLQTTFQANADALNRLALQRSMVLNQPRTGMVASAGSVGDRERLTSEKVQLEERLADLQRRYTPEFPEVVATQHRLDRVTAELKAMPPAKKDEIGSTGNPQLDLIDGQIQQVNAEQKRIQEKIQFYRTKVDTSPVRESQLADLTRNYGVLRVNYQQLLEKNLSAGMAEDLERKQKAERFIILDPAQVPEKPFKPNRRRLMVMAFLGALTASLGLVIAKEQLNTSLKGERELKQMLPSGVSLLASVPLIETPIDRRRRIQFAALAIAYSIMVCLLEAGFLWQVRPIL